MKISKKTTLITGLILATLLTGVVVGTLLVQLQPSMKVNIVGPNLVLIDEYDVPIEVLDFGEAKQNTVVVIGGSGVGEKIILRNNGEDDLHVYMTIVDLTIGTVDIFKSAVGGGGPTQAWVEGLSLTSGSEIWMKFDLHIDAVVDRGTYEWTLLIEGKDA